MAGPAPNPGEMAELLLYQSHDLRALLLNAAEEFLTPSPSTAAAPFPSPLYLLALRQGGLRDDLLRLAGQRNVPGWFDPPLCLFQQLPEWLGATALEPCRDYERIVLVTQVLAETAHRVFGRRARPEAFVAAVDRLFGELMAEDVQPDQFAAALAARADRDDFEQDRDADLAAAYARYRDRLAAAGRRDGRDSIADCARAIGKDAHPLPGLRDRREIRLFGLHDLRGGWRLLLRALVACPRLDRIRIYTAVDLELPPDLAPSGTHRLTPETFPSADSPPEHASAGGGAVLAACLFQYGAEHDTAKWSTTGVREPVTEERALRSNPAAAPLDALQVEIVTCPDVERELEEVARRVRLLVAAGTAPHRIAIISRQARPHMDLAIDALGRMGVPATARQRFALPRIPVVRGLLSLFAVAAEGWSRAGLVELAGQPYLGVDLDASVINHIGYVHRIAGLQAWIEAQDRLLARAEARESGAGAEAEDRRKPLPSARRVHEALIRFRAFARRAAPLDGERSLAEWVDWLDQILTEDPWGIEEEIYAVPEGRVMLARIDAAGWRGVRRIVQQWRAALETWGGDPAPLAVAAFQRRLQEMLEGDVALWTSNQRGVQVLEGLQAAHRDFDHLFLVGLESGQFPLPASRSPILPDADRESLIAAGLPLDRPAAWDRRERELFRVLAAGARRSLTLTHSRLDAQGSEVAGSAFLEEVAERVDCSRTQIPASRVLTPSLPLLVAPDSAPQAAHAARIERLRATGRPSPYNGLIADPGLADWLAREFGDERLWSPTQLEAYAKCPWAYFSGRLLHLEKLEDPDLDVDPLVRGTILHDALRRFYQQAVHSMGGPVLLRSDDAAWALPALAAALDQALQAMGDDLWLGPPALHATKVAELHRLLERYLRAEMDANDKLFTARTGHAPRTLRTAVAEHELPFDDILLEVADVRFRYRGRIDRVEVGVDQRIPAGQYLAAVDYKTSKWSAPGAGDKAAWDDHVVLQVPLYAHALTRLRPGSQVARVEYRAIKQHEAVHSLELVKVDPGQGTASADETARAQMDEALAAVARHVHAARRGEFPARPAPSCACPPFCHAWDICRVKGGPHGKIDR